MALSSTCLSFARVTCNTATATAADRDVPENCKEVVIVNRDSDDVLYCIGTAGAALVDDNTTGVLPGNGALTLAIGQSTERPDGALNVAGKQLVFQSLTGTPRLSLTYLCESGNVQTVSS